MKVMIAESNDSYRLMLEQVIEKDGHTVMTFKDGNEAMKAYQEATDFDVVFSDWELSGMDGLELTRKIRLLDEIRGKPSYIILTAEHGGNWDVMLAMKTGANDMITKHYTENLITERLKSALVHFTQPPGEIKPLESDPIVHLLEEHKILRFQGKKLEELLDKIDEESSGKLINWLGGRSFVLETKVHQDKENSVSITFLERFIKAQGEGSGNISDSSEEWVKKEHQDLEMVVQVVKDSFKEYIRDINQPRKDDSEFNIMEHVDDYPAYCLKCKKKVSIANASLFQMESGIYGFKGECADCGSGVTAFVGRSIDASQKNITLKRSLKKYLRILDDHLEREEEFYFPLVSKYFTQADKERLMVEFEKIEKKYGIDRIGKDFKRID